MRIDERLALTVEVVGVGLTAAGIAVELAFGGDLGCMLITVGSMFIALGGLLWAKVFRRRR